MIVALEVKTGALAGARVTVSEGKTVVVGRADPATVVIPHDRLMSRLHFAVECTARGCRICDRNSTHGTLVNGVRITEAELNPGDEITAGQTVFVVRLPGAAEEQPALRAPAPAAQRMPSSAESGELRLQVGSWTLAHIPVGWEVIEHHGIQGCEDQASPSNVVATEEELPKDRTLGEYVDAQVRVLSELVSDLRVERRRRATVRGATEALEVEIRYRVDEGGVLAQRQVYARASRMVGILTCTAPAERFHVWEVAFDSIVVASTFGGGDAR